MHADPIQSDLSAWHEHADRRALGRVFEQLRHEWAAPVARFLALPVRAPEVEDWLADLLATLLGADRATPPRALAPEGHGNPVAYRALVLRNALRDRLRREQARRRAHQAASPRPSPPQAEPLTSTEEALLLQELRHEVVRALPRLELRRRLALALALGLAPPMAWIEALARELGEPLDATLGRVHACEEDPDDAERRVRVLHPQQALPQARDAFRKTLERAITDLRPLLHRGHA